MTHRIDTSPMRRLLGGNLRANDPRQFLVEVMVGAVCADGRVDRSEERALERILSEHGLFSSLPGHAVPALVTLASDAFYFAGGVEARLKRIATALPWRLHRLAAYEMAIELIAADEVIAAGEEAYLRSLRRIFQIGAGEASQLTDAARSQRGLSTLDQLRDQVHDFIDQAVLAAVAVLRQRGPFGAAEVALIERSFRAMVDFDGGLMVPRERVEQMALDIPRAPGEAALALSKRIAGPTDRYWALTYAVAIDAIAGTARGWERCDLLPVLRLGFEISSRSMDRCEAHGGRIAELAGLKARA